MKTPVKRLFAAATNGKELELLVYDVIGPDWMGEGITPKALQQAIKDAGAFDSITVRLNSPGGDEFDGTAIYNILRQQGKPVTAIVEGLAASAAFTIAMAGDKIQVCDGAMMMLHNALALVIGHAADMRAMADLLDKASGAMGEIYIKRSGQSAAAVKVMMDAETWLTPDEAVAKGFATERLSTTLDKSAQAQALLAQFDLAKFCANVPEALRRDANAHSSGYSIAALRARIAAAALPPPEDPDQPDDDGCGCDCEQCLQGNCQACAVEDCAFEACVHADAAVPPGPPGEPVARVGAEAKTKRVDGEDLPKSAFAYRPDDQIDNWKLPVKFSTEDKTKTHIRDAISRWSGTDMPDAAEKSKARGRIKAAAKEHDIEVDEDSLKDAAAALPDAMRSRRLRLAELAGKHLTSS